MSEQFDLVIIGAGPGGYSTALRAAELGMKVALVERDATVGGTCLNRGCIPSKALITATHTIDTVHRAAELGVNASVNGIDFGTLRDYRLRVVKTMVGGLAGLLAHRGITVFRANAAFHADEIAPATSNHIVHLVPSPDPKRHPHLSQGRCPRTQRPHDGPHGHEHRHRHRCQATPIAR